jgi:hypothetical protein
VDEIIRKVQDALAPLPGGAAALAALGLAVVAILVAFYLIRRFRRRRPVAAAGAPQLVIEVSSLGEEGPPAGPPRLEFYNVPVRLAAIVLGPAGRVRQLPSPAEMPKVFDAIVPGLDKVAAVHNPLVRRWPNQLSARGFAHLFFGSVRLPGDGGKGTPYCSVAGIFKLEGQPVMAGLVLRAASSNSFGQTVIDREEQWLGCLRVDDRPDR